MIPEPGPLEKTFRKDLANPHPPHENMAGTMKLRYVDGRGIAETIRVMLAAAGKSEVRGITLSRIHFCTTDSCKRFPARF